MLALSLGEASIAPAIAERHYRRLYESPFTDLTPAGPDGLFSTEQVDERVAVLERVKAGARVA
ncbi:MULTISPECIES: hypothetical protein [Pseudomonas]|uniref:hypothetical protein n=1 Tax=Pseudomonas TaxID=286 RepID=UPI002305EC90|nr:hypothetical protein [Pseudomonas sp. TUM22785]WCD78693.1 hypothetical protein PI990_22205 [Pseudomonas sp. TUM22785]